MKINSYIKLNVTTMMPESHVFSVRLRVPLQDVPERDGFISLDLPIEIRFKTDVPIRVIDGQPRFKDGTETEWELGPYYPPGVRGSIQDYIGTLVEQERRFASLPEEYCCEIVDLSAEYQLAKQNIENDNDAS